jgi:hypothetical protein
VASCGHSGSISDAGAAEDQAKSASRYLLEAQAKSEPSVQLEAVEERLQVAEHMFKVAEDGSALTTRMNLELGVKLAQAERSVSELQRRCESLEGTQQNVREELDAGVAETQRDDPPF